MTSCCYGFIKNGIVKVTYHYSDSYPTGFGKHIIGFIRENTIPELHELFDKLILVDPDEKPNLNQIAELKTLGIYTGRDEILSWGIISLENDGFMEHYKMKAYFIPNFKKWMFTSNWLYLINLNDDTFEIYKGVAKKIIKGIEKKNRYDNIYLVANYKLDAIPKDWYFDL